jgi:hypothetical protein
MAYDAQYLGRNLTNRVHQAATTFQHEMRAVLSQAASGGAVNSSGVYIQYWQRGLEVLGVAINDAAQFAYNLTGEHTGEVFNQVAFCAKRMVDEMMNSINTRASRAGDQQYGEIVGKTRIAFEELKDSLLDDFKNGMMGSARLKKDPVVSIIANQTDSPGGVQQIGVGAFSQSAFVENHRPLIKAIDDALVSAEFQALGPEEKEGVRDMAKVLRDEASKPNPDAGTLKRWGRRLVEFTKEVGMKTASSTVASLLAKIFTGG